MTRRILFAAAFAALAACSPPQHEVQGDRAAAAAEYATVDSPASGARVSSPLAVSGAAPAAWYFEEQFDTYLMTDDGTVLAQGQARAQSEAAGGGARPFTTELAFAVTADTPATLVLQEQSMGEGEDEPLEVRVPVVLAPAG